MQLFIAKTYGACSGAGYLTTVERNMMTNKSRQPTVGKAVGNPSKGRPASHIANVANTGKRLDSKPLVPGPSDES